MSLISRLVVALHQRQMSSSPPHEYEYSSNLLCQCEEPIAHLER